MKHMLAAVAILFLVSVASAQIQVTEVMSNPEDGNEWVEIKALEEFYVSGLRLSDNMYTDEITCCTDASGCAEPIPAGGYFLIFDQDTTFDASNLSYFFCVDDNAIGNGLGNSGDRVLLLNNISTFGNVTYSFETQKGYSISLIGSVWQEAMPTPGRPNSQQAEEKEAPPKENNETYNSGEELPEETPSEEAPGMTYLDIVILPLLGGELYTGIRYGFFKIENKDYPGCNGQLNLTFLFNISSGEEALFAQAYSPSFKSYTTTNTGQYIFQSPGDYNVCGKILLDDAMYVNETAYCYQVKVKDAGSAICNVSLSMSTQKQVYDEGEKIEILFGLSEKSFPFEITYWTEDLFGNVLKSKTVTGNTDKKSYTPAVDEKDKAILLKSELTKISCNNTNNNTRQEKLLVILGNEEAQEEEVVETAISIDKVIPASKKFSFGDTIKITISLKKGDTTKSAVRLYVAGKETVSEITSLNIYGKNKEYELTLPIVLKPNCNRKYPDGKYNIIVEGLDISESADVDITGFADYCETKQNDPPNKNDNEIEVLYIPKNISLGDKAVSILMIKNTDSKSHTYSVWSYIYSGKKTYSGGKEVNRISVEINPEKSELVVLENRLNEIPEKEAKLKISVLREDKKTANEIMESISFFGPPVLYYNDKTQAVADAAGKKELEKNRITGDAVYESSSSKVKNYSVYFLAVSLLLGGGILIRKLVKPSDIVS